MSERRQAASWIADEYGGSYLNNPEQQNRDLAAANDMAILIQRIVRDRGGGEAGYRRAGELINETLDELSARAPFGFVTPAFALGMTQVLLEKANSMDGPQFLQYLDGIRDRDNPLFFWQRSTLDPLFEEVKSRTQLHVEEVYGRSTFTVFDAMKGQSGPVAFAAGYADAILDEIGTGGRSIVLGAANPLEAGRQAVDMMRNLDRVPQALRQVVREADQLIQASMLDDYHKGFLAVKISLIALDAVDVAEAGLAIGNLARRMRGGEIRGIDDALQALDNGPQEMRQRGQTNGANDLAAGDIPARTRTVTDSPNTQAVAITERVLESVPETRRQDYREAVNQLLRHNGYDTPDEVNDFFRWINENPDSDVTRSLHQIAQNSMQQRMLSAYPDRVEFAYQRALDDTFRDAGLTTPQQRMGYMEAFNGANGAAFRTALDERALTHVVDNSLRQIPDNVRDAYRGSLASILSEQGYLGQGRFDPAGAQQYINNLAGAPGGPSAMAVHNRAMNIVVNGAADRFPDGTEAYYARAYRQTFEAENIRSPSAAQRYIDNLDAAPNGPAMRAVNNRAIANIVTDVVDDLPPNVQAAYSRALRLTLDQAGADTPSEALSYVRNLTDGRQVQSIAALHQRAFDSVMQSAVASIDEPSRAAYSQALRESLDAGGRGPARNADGSAAWDYGSVERLQQYVVDLSTSPQTMQRIHDRADELLGRSRTPDPTPQTPPQDRVDPPNNTQPPVQPPPQDRVDPPNNTQPPVQPPPQDRVDPPNNTQPPPQTPPQDRVDPPNNTQPPPQNPPPNDRQTPDPDQPRLNPSSQPNDPLLPFHAVERDQRMRAPEPLVAPNGQRFDVMGVDEDGRLRLRPEGQRVDALPSEAMFEMRATAPQALAESGNPVMYGREPWLTAGRNENGIVLRDPQNAERTVVVPDARAAEIFTPVGRDVTYQGETWRFQALLSPGWQKGVDQRGFQLVDPDNPERTVFVPENRAVDIRMRLGEDGEYRFGDVRHGVIRMRPMEPDREISMPLQPGMTFEARLRDREMEGAYRITVGDNGELTATGRIRNGTEVTQRIEPSDIAPRYVDVRSPDFNDSFQVDSFIHREANTRNRAISTEPTGLPLRDPAFGNLDGTPSPQLALGAQSLQTQADFIRRNAGNLEPGQTPSLTVFNIAFNNQGEARQVLDAMSDFRQMHPDAPIRIVAYEPSFRSFEGKPGFDELQRIIERDRIQVEFFGRDPSQREVIHAKGVAVNDQVLFSTGAVIDGSSQKADISVPLPPDAARAFNAYLNEAAIGDADVGRRQQLAADAAREGVLINDPEARLPYIARAQDGLIRGAERELTVSVSELRNPETTRAIIERAEAGVNVQVQFREMDPESRQLLADAQQRLPNLKVEDVSAWQPRPHYNVIIADREQAYVGTAYLWQNQQDMLQHGRSFENGVLLQGDAVQRLQAQMEGLRSLQPSNPGQRLLNSAPDDAPDVGVRLRNETTGSISISAPANSSIGVDVQNSTTGTIQTVSGSGNVQVSGNRETLGTAATTTPDVNGNVQATDTPGLRIELQNPGTSGRTGTDVRIDNSTVNGGVQSIIGNQNIQIDINEARINGDRRQTVTDGDNNRQTQNLGANVTAGSVTQTIDGRSDSRQQIGNDVPAPLADVSVTGSLSSVQGNRNSVVQGDGNTVQIGAGNNAVVNGVRVDVPTPETSNPQPVDGRLAGGVQNSTVNGSVSAVQGNQNTVVEGDGNTVRIGGETVGEERGAVRDPASGERKLEYVGEPDAHLRGQSVAYTPRFSTRHDLTGDGAGTYTTISGHGVLETDYVIPPIGNSVQRDTFVVPEGVNLHFLGLPGGVITDRLGQRADVGGDLSGVPLLKLGTGDTAPDILITPAFGTINIQGNPITVDNPQGVRLSQLIRDHDLSGNIVVSTCLQQSVSQGNREHWQGITFDLPDRYPKPDPPDLSNIPPRLPIDPNFHTQHGLTNTGEGTYTAIGGNAGLSGVNPYTQRPFAEQTFTVPEGVTVYFPSLPGGSVHNRLAETIEKGEDLSRIALLKAGSGTTAPDPLLLPGNYEVAGNFLRITDRDGQRLSEVIQEHGLTGNVVVAGGLNGPDRPHSNVLFDVPEQYQQRSAPGGTRGFDLNPEQTIAPQPQVQSPSRRSLEAEADNGDRIVAQTPDQRNLLQRTWDGVLDTRLPAIGNITVYAQQSGPDAKWQASLPVPAGDAIHKLQAYMANNIRGDSQASVDDFMRPAGAATNKLQEYMANNARGDSQASVDDFLRLVDPRRVADVKHSPPSTLAGGVDFVTGVQRVQSLKIEIDGANVEGGALRWDAKASAYQLDVTADAGGYVLNAPLKVTPGESVTPLSVSGARLTGPAANAVDFPGVSVKMSDEYGAITLPAGTRLSAENVGLMNEVLANPEYRSRAGETQYGSSAKANYVVSEPRGDADARDNVFNRVFAGEYGALEAPKQKLEVNLSPALLGIHVSNPPMHGTRVGFEVERVQGPTIRELMEGLREGIAPREQTPPTNDNRQSSLPESVAPTQTPREPGLDDPRHPNHTMFASALDRIHTFERGRGIDSGDFARNLAGDITVRSVEAGLPQISHVVFNAEGTRAFAVDTQNLDAEWRRVAYTDVASAGQQSLAASSERLRESQAQALSQPNPQQDAQQRLDEQARSGARMV
jgi:hypothetical protein